MDGPWKSESYAASIGDSVQSLIGAIQCNTMRVVAPYALREGGSSQSRLLAPLFFVLLARRCGMASLLSCAFYLGRFPTHFIVVLKLFFLTVLESGAPLCSSGLKEAL